MFLKALLYDYAGYGGKINRLASILFEEDNGFDGPLYFLNSASIKGAHILDGIAIFMSRIDFWNTSVDEVPELFTDLATEVDPVKQVYAAVTEYSGGSKDVAQDNTIMAVHLANTMTERRVLRKRKKECFREGIFIVAERQ